MAGRHADDGARKDGVTDPPHGKDVVTDPESAVDGPDRTAADRPAAGADREAVEAGGPAADDADGAAGDDGEDAVSRRTALKVAGAGATAGLGSSLLGSTADAATTVLHAVDDLGWDPNGNRDVSGSLDAHLQDDTTIRVPPGDYRFTGTAWGSPSNFTLEGTGSDHRDVRFLPPKGSRLRFLNLVGGRVTLRNFSVDQYDDTETSVNIRVKTTGFLIEDVEHLGFTPDDGDGSAGNQLTVSAENRGSRGVVRRYYNRNGGQIHTYPDRQAIVWVSGSHRGIVTFEDCVIIEAGGSAIYATRHDGTVRVDGGYYVNNDHHDMRISNERGDKLGWIRGATFFADYSLCNFSKADSHEGGEGTWIEHGTDSLLIEDCDYWYRDPYPTKPASGYTHFPGVVQIRDYTGDVTFRNCRLCNDVTDDSFMTGPTLEASGLSAPLTVDGCSFTGASPRSAVVADAGVVRDSVVQMPNGGAVRGGIDTSNVSHSGADAATLGDLASVYPGHDTIDGSGSGGDPLEPTYEHTLTIDGTDADRSDYAFTVSGDLAENPSVGSLGTGDTIDGSSATGFVHGGVDGYRYNGDVTDFSIDGNATVLVDGTAVDPATLGDGTTYPNALRIEGTGSWADYAFTVSEALREGGDTLGTGDSIDGTSAEGFVVGGRDAYEFAGEITAFDLQGDARVVLNGSEVDPADLGETSQLPRTLVVDGSDGGSADYGFAVTGEIENDPDVGTFDAADAVGGSTATGVVGGGVDGYRFSGEIVSVEYDGDAAVRVDGRSVDPAALGLPNRVVFDGSGTDGESSYEFAVSGTLVADSLAGGVEDTDTVDGAAASGTVADGADAFRFSGDLTRLLVVGYADVTFEDNDG